MSVPLFRWDVPGPYEVVFSTRRGGVSEGLYESLNLGLLTADRREHTLENRRRLCDGVGADVEQLAMNRQVHGAIVNSAVDDPHSFEASPADAAAIIDASLVVYNGGGYDQWVDDVLSGHPGVTTVNAYSLLPGTVAQPANEHVFYDPTTAKAVAVQIAEFGKRADEILQIERAIGQTHPGTAVVATEPVAHYLLVNAGITDKTPQGFSSAVEEDADPAPADLAVMLDLINTHQVSALLFNPQTQTAVTKQIQDAAQRASVPVVTVTETLPNGTDYLTWQRQTAQQLASQLDNAPQTNR